MFGRCFLKLTFNDSKYIDSCNFHYPVGKIAEISKFTMNRNITVHCGEKKLDCFLEVRASCRVPISLKRRPKDFSIKKTRFKEFLTNNISSKQNLLR